MSARERAGWIIRDNVGKVEDAGGSADATARAVVEALEAAGLTVVETDDQARSAARKALTLARRLLNTHATERKGGPLVSRLSSGEFTARMNELAALERELG